MELLRDIAVWIVSVVIVGIGINWLSEFLKPSAIRTYRLLLTKIKEFGARTSPQAKEQHANWHAASAKKLQHLREHPESITELRVVIFQQQAKVFLCIITAIILLIFMRVLNPNGLSLTEETDPTRIQFFLMNLGIIILCFIYAFLCIVRWTSLKLLLKMHLHITQSPDLGEWYKSS